MPTDAQRIALWRAYDLICPYCGKPIDSYFHLEIDHIIPQHFLHRPHEVQELLIRLGFPDLDLNSYPNWLPVHGRPCNRDKSGEVQPDTTLLNYLGVARRHHARAQQEEQQFIRGAKAGVAIASIKHLIDGGVIKREELNNYLNESVEIKEERQLPIRMTQRFYSQFDRLHNASLQDAQLLVDALRSLADGPSSSDSAVKMGGLRGTYVRNVRKWRVYYTRSPEAVTVLSIETKADEF